MAHIEDRWTVTGPDGQKARTARHGTGLRWRVRYLDPGGAERSKSFARKPDAERFLTATAAKVQDGTWSDPALGRLTLRRYAEEVYLPAQTSEATTQEAVELRFRLHILPVLGDRALGQLAAEPSVIRAWAAGLQADLAGRAHGFRQPVRLPPGRRD